MTSAFSTGPERDAWLAERRKGIGGSDVPALMGLSNYETPLELYTEKLRAPDDTAQPVKHESASWGNKLEHIVAEEFEQRTGLEVYEPGEGVEFWSEEYPFMRASIDRYVLKPYGKTDSFLECKTRSSYAEKYWATGVPLDVRVQVQHTMTVTQFDHAYVAVLLGGQKFLWFRLEHDPALEAEILAAESEFWDRVRRHDPPPEGPKDAEALVQQFDRVENAKRVKLTDAQAELVKVYKALEEEQTYVAKRMTDIGGRIQAAMGDAGRAMYQNRIAATWLEQPRRVLDVARLEAEHPTLVHGYYTTQTERVLKVKGIKEE